MSARVAVVTPTVRDRPEWMRGTALASVAKQTHPCAHIILPGDGREPGEVRNEGVRAAAAMEAEWVAFLDDDDYIEPFHVEALLRIGRETGADVVWSRFRVSPQVGTSARRLQQLGDLARLIEQIGGNPAAVARAIRRTNCIPVTVLARTAALTALGGFPTGEDLAQYAGHEDWGLWSRLIGAGARFEHVPMITWSYRVHSGSRTAQRSREDEE